jgi:excinuclease ABC subunit C
MAKKLDYRPSGVPDEPGVYRFYDEVDRVIYVGKARSLKNRLNSYFQKNIGEKTARLVERAVRVDWTIVRNEVEALQLEFTWIKEENPEFNVQFKDDKSYPYLALSLKEKVPRLFITRRKSRKDITYFGPFIHAWALKSTFDLLLDSFGVRSCTTSNFEQARKTKRQCLLGDIGKCAAPCVEWISEEEHLERAKELATFMSTGKGDIKEKLMAKMKQASVAEDYERAARIRDQISAYEKAIESTDAAISTSITGDFLAIHQDVTHAAISIFRIRSGRVIGSRTWIIELKNLPEDTEISGVALSRVYEEFEPPREIYLNFLTDEESLNQYFSEKFGEIIRIRIPERGEKFEILEMVKRNSHQGLIQFLSKRANDSAVSGKALEELAESLSLSELPLRIECFDISNIQGTSVVASMVVFEEGQAKKSEYRRFGIDDREKFDDTRAMHHVITRRFKRYLEERDLDLKELEISGGDRPKFAYPPNLVIVDGGRGQVNAAARALAELGIENIPIVGLAKRLEEIWLPQKKYPIILPRRSEALYLVQRIRDEAHRFAVTFHRTKRSRMMLESLLDEIPNLGEVRRRSILDRFGSIAALRKASIEEIAQIPGFGEKIASQIIHSLANSEEDALTALTVDAATGEIIEPR